MSNSSSEILCQAWEANPCTGWLTLNEVKSVSAQVRALHALKILKFASIDPFETTKEEMRQALPRAACRRARSVSVCLATNETFIDVIALDKSQGPCDSEPSGYVLTDVQVPISSTEYFDVAQLVIKYEPLKQVLLERGLLIENVKVDAWCVGYSGPDDAPTERLSWPLLLYQEEGVDETPYARPIEGIGMRISITHNKVSRYWQ
jgi:Cu2+-containing amine oxidase